MEKEKISQKTKEFFEKMGVNVEIEAIENVDDTLKVKIKTSTKEIDLVGEKGKTLYAIQHLLKAMWKKEMKENFYLDLDINSFKEKRFQYLIEMAQRYADEVSLVKKEIILEPLPPQERRLIHLELAKRTDVTTFSIGKGEHRRLVIKPC